MSRGNFVYIILGSQSGGIYSIYINMYIYIQYMCREREKVWARLLDTEVTTSIPLLWGRWIPGCTSYIAAQWGCCCGIDLVDPREPPLLASPHSSALNAIWKRGEKRGRQRDRREGMIREWKREVRNDSGITKIGSEIIELLSWAWECECGEVVKEQRGR